MSITSLLLLSCVAMALLTVLVALRLLWERVNEMRSRRIPIQAVATSRQSNALLQDTRSADNFRNLFEVPVLFYTLCGLLLASQHVRPGYVVGAWLFVALRLVHSLIHCTYNHVGHRLVAFLSGLAVVTAMWVTFGLDLLGQRVG